jgi:tetratricopeptide (TPR) repeat protein
MRRLCIIAIVGAFCLIGSAFGSNADDPADTAAVRSHLLELMKDVRRLEEKQTLQSVDTALRLLDSVRTVAITHFGYLDSLAIAALTWQGACYDRNTLLELSDSTLRLAIELWKESLGPAHSNVGNTMRMLANTLRRRARLAEAEPLYLDAITILEQDPRSDVTHMSRIAAARLELGALFGGQGKYEKTLEMYTKAREAYRDALGEGSRRDGFGMYYMALANINLGRYDAAESLLTRALEIYENTVGEDHPETVGIIRSLGRICRRKNNPEKAKQYQMRALEIAQRIGGDKLSATRLVLRELVAIATLEEDHESAIGYLKRALAIEESLFGTDWNYLTGLLGALAKAEFALGSSGYLDHMKRWVRLRHNFYQNVFSYASEEQKLRYVRNFPPIASIEMMPHTKLPLQPHRWYSTENLLS